LLATGFVGAVVDAGVLATGFVGAVVDAGVLTIGFVAAGFVAMGFVAIGLVATVLLVAALVVDGTADADVVAVAEVDRVDDAVAMGFVAVGAGEGGAGEVGAAPVGAAPEAGGAELGPGCGATGRGGSCCATYSCAARVPMSRNLTRRNTRPTPTTKRSAANSPDAISDTIDAKPPPHPNPGSFMVCPPIHGKRRLLP
jgi:hypothetical protein